MKRFLQTKHEVLAFYILILFSITLPLRNNYNSMTIMLLTVFSIALLFVGEKLNKVVLKKYIPLIVYFIIAIMSLLYTEHIEIGIKTGKRLLPFIILPFVFSIIQLKTNHFERLLKFFVFWMLLLCFYSHTQVLIKLYNNNDILYNIFNSYYSYLSLSEDTIGLHSTYYAYYVIIAIVFLTKFLFEAKSNKLKLVYTLILVYFTFFVFHLSARLPIATLFFFYNLAILYFFFKKRKILIGVVVLLLFYIATSLVIYNVRITRYRFQHLTGFTYSDGTQHDDGKDKLLQWKASIAANKNLVFGNGIGDANQDIISSNLNFDLKKNAEREYNAHNQFIETFVGMGLIGLSVLLFIFLYYFSLFIKDKERVPAVLLILTFLLYQTESYLERHNGVVMMIFLLCLFTLKTYCFKNKIERKNNP